MDLEIIKNTVEGWTKHHQIEVLKIIKKDPSITINENKSGIYVNISFLPEQVISDISDYIKYVKEQETILNKTETQKDELNSNFFV
jgi:hypothetical protein